MNSSTISFFMTEGPSAQPLGMDVPPSTNNNNDNDTNLSTQGKLNASAALPTGTVATDSGEAPISKQRGVWWKGGADDNVTVDTCVFDKYETASSIQPAVVSNGKAAPTILRQGKYGTPPTVEERLNNASRFELLFDVWEDYIGKDETHNNFLGKVTRTIFRRPRRLEPLTCSLDALQQRVHDIELQRGVLPLVFQLLESKVAMDNYSPGQYSLDKVAPADSQFFYPPASTTVQQRIDTDYTIARRVRRRQQHNNPNRSSLGKRTTQQRPVSCGTDPLPKRRRIETDAERYIAPIRFYNPRPTKRVRTDETLVTQSEQDAYDVSMTLETALQSLAEQHNNKDDGETQQDERDEGTYGSDEQTSTHDDDGDENIGGMSEDNDGDDGGGRMNDDNNGGVDDGGDGNATHDSGDDDDDDNDDDDDDTMDDNTVQLGSMYIHDPRYPTHSAVRRSCRVVARQRQGR